MYHIPFGEPCGSPSLAAWFGSTSHHSGAVMAEVISQPDQLDVQHACRDHSRSCECAAQQEQWDHLHLHAPEREAYLHFRQADQRTQTVLLLRDDFWSNEAPPNEVRAPMHLVDAFLVLLMNLRDAFLKTL